MAACYAEVADILQNHGDLVITTAPEFTDEWMTLGCLPMLTVWIIRGDSANSQIFEGRRYSCARNIGRTKKVVDDAKIAVAECLAPMGFALVSFQEWNGRDIFVDVIDANGSSSALAKSPIDQRFQRFR